MPNPYTHPKWLAFREQCIQLADYKCERCEKEGILQVHHPEYEKGRKPWEYAPQFCEVLCRGCHAAEHGHVLPREGWVILHSDLDNEEPSDPVPCANCGLEVMWHFTIFHEQWGETIVGSSCAENLSLGPALTELKSYYRRRRTFVFSPRWKETRDCWWLNQHGCEVLIYRMNSDYQLQIGDKLGKLKFPTVEEAKIRAFEVFENRNKKQGPAN